MAVPSLHILDYSSDDGEKEYKLKADLIVHINAEFTARHRDLMEGSALSHAKPEEVFSRFEAEYKRLTANYTPAELRELTDMGNPIDRFENQEFPGDGGIMDVMEEDPVNVPVVVDPEPTTSKPKRKGPVPSRKLRKKTRGNTKTAKEDAEVIETGSNVIVIPSTPIAPVRHKDYDLSSPDLSEAEEVPSVVDKTLDNGQSTSRNLLVGVCIPSKQQKSPSHSPSPQISTEHTPQRLTRQPTRIRTPSSSVIVNHFAALYKRKLKSSKPRVYMKKKIGINALIDKCYRSRRIDQERGFPSKCPEGSYLGRNLRKGTLVYNRLYPTDAARPTGVSARGPPLQKATRGRRKRKT